MDGGIAKLDELRYILRMMRNARLKLDSTPQTTIQRAALLNRWSVSDTHDHSEVDL